MTYHTYYHSEYFPYDIPPITFVQHRPSFANQLFRLFVQLLYFLFLLLFLDPDQLFLFLLDEQLQISFELVIALFVLVNLLLQNAALLLLVR